MYNRTYGWNLASRWIEFFSGIDRKLIPERNDDYMKYRVPIKLEPDAEYYVWFEQGVFRDKNFYSLKKEYDLSFKTIAN